MDILLWLQKWYAENCIEDWQHFYGIKIDTLDNPGWAVKIDLTDTAVENKAFLKINRDNGDDDWLSCKVEHAVFEAGCNPDHLVTVLEIFKNWVENGN